MRKVLVTGGAGFIGSHACKALARAGFQPVVFDNLSTGNRDAVRWGQFVPGDVRDAGGVLQALKEHRISAVMHFAASAYVGESVSNPALYYDNNVVGMSSLLDACRTAGIEQVVFSSSCATYGHPDTLPITEATPQAPINPYGRTKLICEQMLADFRAAYGLQSIALRYFNAAGADPEGELAERHDPETHLIPLALLSAAGRRGPLQVFGTDYDTPDGTCIRDYIHVSDLAAAHVAALKHLFDGGETPAVNLGTGRGHSIREVLRAIRQVTGADVPVIHAPRRAGDPPELVADTSLAAKLLGFAPNFPDLRDMIAHAAPSFGLNEVRDVA